MQLDQYNKAYFLGVGGVGMSALARWFNKNGMEVHGYDATPTPITQKLIEEGIIIHFDENIEAIPGSFTKEKTLVVYTPAIPRDSIELTYLRDNRFTVLKRSKVLGLIVNKYKTVAVAGTHGKTTTSALIAHILKQARKNMVAFLGGVTTNYATNLVIEGETTEDTIFIAEADEFDCSFLTLFPDIAVVTSIDVDHLDSYENAHLLRQSFANFIDQIKTKGMLVLHQSVSVESYGLDPCTYGLEQGQVHATEICVEPYGSEFNLIGLGKKIEKIKLSMPGFHNIENAIAAIIVTHQLGVNIKTVLEALNSFKGIKRRFELIIEQDDVVYIDDYAHHPVEITSLITSLRAMYPARKITLIFQPHLYTRTRDLAQDFAQSLSMTDEILLMDIYPAREKPIPGVTSDMIFESITAAKLKCKKEDLLQKLAERDIEILATVGAGDIGTYAESIKELIKKKHDGA